MDYHHQAETLREQESFNEALNMYEKAINEYKIQDNFQDIAEALLGTFLTYKHLFITTQDVSYAQKAKSSVLESLQLLNQHKITNNLHQVYFSLGECEMLFKHYSDAIKPYKQALTHYPVNDAQKGNYRYHLGEALYRSGNKRQGELELYRGLDEIKAHKKNTDPFLLHVWLSGCHMRITELLWHDKPNTAKEHLKMAELIIKTDKKLILRKNQLTRLKSRLN